MTKLKSQQTKSLMIDSELPNGKVVIAGREYIRWRHNGLSYLTDLQAWRDTERIMNH